MKNSRALSLDAKSFCFLFLILGLFVSFFLRLGDLHVSTPESTYSNELIPPHILLDEIGGEESTKEFFVFGSFFSLLYFTFLFFLIFLLKIQSFHKKIIFFELAIPPPLHTSF